MKKCAQILMHPTVVDAFSEYWFCWLTLMSKLENSTLDTSQQARPQAKEGYNLPPRPLQTNRLASPSLKLGQVITQIWLDGSIADKMQPWSVQRPSVSTQRPQWAEKLPDAAPHLIYQHTALSQGNVMLTLHVLVILVLSGWVTKRFYLINGF